MLVRHLIPFFFVLALEVNGKRLRRSQLGSRRLHREANIPEQHVRASQGKPAKKFLNDKSASFAVDSTAIPDVDFDVGESYAGLLPISEDPNAPELYFWFFPSTSDDIQQEIVIWLNGGPGCSSLEGLLQEIGPISWQPGTFGPVPNSWSWTNLTNVVWVDQPVGTGYSQGNPTAVTDEDVATQFLGFFRNFISTFSMQGYTVYLGGESWAGTYIAYIADAMFSADDAENFNLSSIILYDPSLSSDAVQSQIAFVSFLDYWASFLHLDSTILASIHEYADMCNYTTTFSEYFTFPSPLRSVPIIDGPSPQSPELCDVQSFALSYLEQLFPCFNIYNILASLCPLPYDPIGYPGTYPYRPAHSPLLYFARPDVQYAIHAPPMGANWKECVDKVFATSDGEDQSEPPALNGVLQRVIEQSDRTLIVHGEYDFLMQANGTLFALQNLTWNGQRGFSAYPDRDFHVSPGFPSDGDTWMEVQRSGTASGTGTMGKFVSERGVTFILQWAAGHMVPQYVPGAAYRHLEFVLGRITVDDLERPADIED